MALKVVNEGELELLDKMLKDALSTDEKYLLRLYKNDVTPGDSDTTASYLIADFTDYANRTLDRFGWNAAQTSGTKAESSYGAAPESWTCGATGNTIYGYWVEGANSNKCLWAERFATSRVLADGDVLNISPKFSLSTE
jgi:hypothetical protein